MTTSHTPSPPSDWVRRWTHLISPGTRVLDLACGHGRHSRWLASLGHPVTAVDRDTSALASLADLAPQVTALAADIENGPWPLDAQTFGALVVTNYLWRPLWPRMLDSLAPGGILIYETFAHGNASVGKPSRPDFLLKPGELLDVCRGLRIIAYEDGFLTGPDRYVQRIAAVKEMPPSSSDELLVADATPMRYILTCAG